MTALLTAPLRPGSAASPFAFGWVTADGADERVPLADAWSMPFEDGRPLRRFPSRKGERHLSGLWWSATSGAHVGFESWLGRDHEMLPDFETTIWARQATLTNAGWPYAACPPRGAAPRLDSEDPRQGSDPQGCAVRGAGRPGPSAQSPGARARAAL